MADNNVKSFKELENETNLREILDKYEPDKDSNVYNYEIDPDIVKKAHYVDENGIIYPLEN